MKQQFSKALAIILALATISSLVLSVLGVVSWMIFWIIAVLSAVYAYGILPRLRKH